VNPQFTKPQTLAGVWRHGHSAFELSADGTWRCIDRRDDELPCVAEVAGGRWDASDGDGFVRFFSSSNVGLTQLQALAYRGEYRLIQPVEDFDGWNGDLGYERAPAH
jgi:hypothetical protein